MFGRKISYAASFCPKPDNFLLGALFQCWSQFKPSLNLSLSCRFEESEDIVKPWGGGGGQSSCQRAAGERGSCSGEVRLARYFICPLLFVQEPGTG